jgi:uncharacterized OB-fold protein
MSARPLPEITPEMAPFWEAAHRRQLVVQRCSTCGTHRFPARDLCSRCLGREADWVPVSGRGSLFSYAVMHQVYHPGFADRTPYAVVVVELDCGARLVSNLRDTPLDRIEIGMPLEVAFEELSGDVTLPVFRPAAPA